MDVKLAPNLQVKLDDLAAERGREVESLVHEAIERLVDHEAWFREQVEKGLAAERGDLIEDAGVRHLIDEQFPA